MASMGMFAPAPFVSTYYVTFREDDARCRQGYGDQNFAILLQLARNVPRHDTLIKFGTKGKSLKAGCNEACLLHLLTSAI